MKSVGVVLCLFLLAGCGQAALSHTPTESPVPSVQVIEPTAVTEIPAGESVQLMTSDGNQLDGNFYAAEGDMAVVFAHMGITNQTSWQPFAADVAEAGVHTLTFDFSCFGKSKCVLGMSDETCLTDVLTAIRYLRDRGYPRIVCIGASMGATACLNASMEEDLAGIVFIAGVKSRIVMSTKLYPDDIINPGMQKLFLTDLADPYFPVVTDTEGYYEVSPEPKRFLTFAEGVHGTDLFQTPSGSQFHQALMDFILALK